MICLCLNFLSAPFCYCFYYLQLPQMLMCMKCIQVLNHLWAILATFMIALQKGAILMALAAAVGINATFG